MRCELDGYSGLYCYLYEPFFYSIPRLMAVVINYTPPYPGRLHFSAICLKNVNDKNFNFPSRMVFV